GEVSLHICKEENPAPWRRHEPVHRLHATPQDGPLFTRPAQVGLQAIVEVNLPETRFHTNEHGNVAEHPPGVREVVGFPKAVHLIPLTARVRGRLDQPFSRTGGDSVLTPISGVVHRTVWEDLRRMDSRLHIAVDTRLQVMTKAFGS